MGTNLFKPFFFRLAIEVILLLLQTTLLVNPKDACMTTVYYFNRVRDTVKNHALRGHVIANVTARKPLFCFDACRLECRCISFNFKQSADQDNCQLNEENRYTNFGALEFAEGWQYYDLVYNNIRVRESILLLNTALFMSLSNKKWHSSMTFNDIILKFVFLWQTWLWGFATFCSNTCYLGRGISCSTFFFSLIFRLLIVRTTAVKAYPCHNGGTCRESCDVIGRRFTCKCGPHSYGRLCEGKLG